MLGALVLYLSEVKCPRHSRSAPDLWLKGAVYNIRNSTFSFDPSCVKLNPRYLKTASAPKYCHLIYTYLLTPISPLSLCQKLDFYLQEKWSTTGRGLVTVLEFLFFVGQSFNGNCKERVCDFLWLFFLECCQYIFVHLWSFVIPDIIHSKNIRKGDNRQARKTGVVVLSLTAML